MTPFLATVILDPFTTLIVGSALALFSGKLIRKNPQVELRTTALLAAGWSAWYGLCVGWFFFMRPDWMLVYLTDSQKVPLVPAYAFFLLALVMVGVCGALAGGVLMHQQKLGLAIGLVAMAAVTNLVLTVLQMHAYNHVGTFAQYAKGEAPELAADPTMGLAMGISGAAATLPAVALLGLRFMKARAT